MGFGYLSVKNNNIMAFKDEMSCILVDVYQRFGGIHCMHLQVRRSE
jgi:hypothetical protein